MVVIVVWVWWWWKDEVVVVIVVVSAPGEGEVGPDPAEDGGHHEGDHQLDPQHRHPAAGLLWRPLASSALGTTSRAL